jgi:Flp pilus assembly protein TadG
MGKRLDFEMRRAGKGFWTSRSGGVAMIFGLAFVPLMLMAGGALDYGRFLRAKSQVQLALDASALAGTTAASGVLKASGTVAAATTAGINAATNAFNANLASNASMTVASFTPGPTVTATSAVFSPKATVNVSTTLLNIVGLSSVAVSAQSTSAATSGSQFVDVYVLVDASQSMAIGASATDQANMQADSKIGCMLACHNNSSVNPSAFDAIAWARSQGYQLRFDVIRNALKTIVANASSISATSGSTIRFGVYSFAVNFKTEVDITSNYTTINSAINNMDVADLAAGTSTKNALDLVKAKIGAVGDGSSAAKPKVFVLLMTDGVGNANDNEASYWTYSTTIYPAYDGVTCWAQTPPKDGTPGVAPTGTPRSPPCVPDPYIAGTPSTGPAYHVGNGQMELNGVDPAWCSPIKSMGATLMTLNTSYVLENNPTDWRTVYLQNVLISQIPGNMQACASTSADAFVANDATQVTSAINAMFARVTKLSTPRLTR